MLPIYRGALVACDGRTGLTIVDESEVPVHVLRVVAAVKSDCVRHRPGFAGGPYVVDVSPGTITMRCKTIDPGSTKPECHRGSSDRLNSADGADKEHKNSHNCGECRKSSRLYHMIFATFTVWSRIINHYVRWQYICHLFSKLNDPVPPKSRELQPAHPQ